jgi:O-antigen ligase
MTLFSSILAGFGVILLVVDTLVFRHLLKVPHIKWLLAFLLIMIVSSLLNIRYGWFDNAKTIVWQAIQLGLFLPLFLILSKQKFRTFFQTNFWILFIITAAICFLSFVEFLLQINYFLPLDDELVQAQGFSVGRLFGVLGDPNFLAVLIVCIMVSAWYYLRNFSVTRGQKRFLYATLVLEWLVFICANSRIGLLCFLVMAFIVLASLLRNTASSSLPHKWAGLFKAFMVIAVIPVLMFVVLTPLSATYANWMHDLNLMGESETTTKTSVFLAARQDTQKDDVSNNRFRIWSDYLTFSQDTLVFGKSPRNLLPEIIALHPDSYVAEKTYETHNGYIYLFCATGIAGTVPWLVVIAFFLAKTIRYVKQHKTLDDSFIYLLTLVFLMGTKALTHGTVFFSYNLDASIFYIAFGALFIIYASDRQPATQAVPTANQVSDNSPTLLAH